MDSENMGTSPAVVMPVPPSAGGKLPGTFQLLSKTFSTYKQHAGQIAVLSVFPAVLSVVGAVSSGIVVVIAQLLLMIVAVLQVIVLIRYFALSNRTTVGVAYKTALPIFWSALWISILSALVGIGGVVLLIIPGIYLGIMMMFSQIVLVTENRRGRDALATSWRYVSPYGLAVFGRMLLGSIIVGLITGIVLAIVSAIAGELTAQIITSLAAYLVFIPLIYIFELEIFENLKVRFSATVPDNKKSLITGFAILGLVVFVGMFALVAFSGIWAQVGRLKSIDSGTQITPTDIQIPSSL